MDDRSPKREEEPRRGTARWRHQQRKKRKQEAQRDKQMVRRTGEQRQLSPTSDSRFSLADIDWPVETLRLLGYLLLATVLVLGMIFTLRFFNPPDETAPPNAIWLGSGWSFDQPTDEDVLSLAERLQRHEIGTAYVWVTYLKEDRTWSGKTADRDPETGAVLNTVNPDTGEPYQNQLAEMEPNIKQFVEQYNTAYPQGQLYGWISFPAGVNPLDDRMLHTRVAELSTLLVTDYGFDGIYLNVEPVTDGDEDFLRLLRAVRLALDEVAESSGQDSIPLAAAIPPDWRPSDSTIPYGPLITDVFEWSEEYKQNVSLLVDEMLIMSYQSGLQRAADYSAWVAYQTKAYAEAAATVDVGTEVLIGVPTYPAEPPGHDPAVENVQSAIVGLRSGLLQAGEAADVVRGTVIYAEWTTDADEWSAFYNNWIDPPES